MGALGKSAGSSALILFGTVLSLALGCATTREPAQSHYDFFTQSIPEGDPWSEKIRDWQKRERGSSREPIRDAAVPVPGRHPNPAPWALPSKGPDVLLTDRIRAYRAFEKRHLVQRVATFNQAQSIEFYRHDPESTLTDDHWPSTRELYERNGDDCDGLDLIAYNLLLDFGFADDEIYRAVIRRKSDGANHMVTLWFEKRDDPWVVDGTGAITYKIRRFSELKGWLPVKVFDEDEMFDVTEHSPLASR